MRPAKSLSKKGFTLVEIMIVVAIIGLLAAIAIPNFVRARLTSQTNTCIYNMRQIDGAKQNWGLDYKGNPTSTPSKTQIQPYLGRGNGTLPNCPLDSTTTFDNSYNINNLQSPPTCKLDSTNHVYN